MFLAEILSQLEWEILFALQDENGFPHSYLWSYESIQDGHTILEFEEALSHLISMGYVEITKLSFLEENFYHITNEGSRVITYEDSTEIL